MTALAQSIWRSAIPVGYQKMSRIYEETKVKHYSWRKCTSLKSVMETNIPMHLKGSTHSWNHSVKTNVPMHLGVSKTSKVFVKMGSNYEALAFNLEYPLV